jgi:hypothetical protein
MCPDSFPNISCVRAFRFRIPKITISQYWFYWPFLNYQNQTVKMDLKYKQQAVVEFRLLEGVAGEEIVIPSGRCPVQLHTAVIQYSGQNCNASFEVGSNVLKG